MSIHFSRWSGIFLLCALGVTISSLYFRGAWRNPDVELYHLYAVAFWSHPTHGILPTEYPPLSVLVFALTLLGPSAWFPETFALYMVVIAVLGYTAFRRFTSPGQASAYAVYSLAAGLGTVFFRFDLVPALIAAAAVWCLTQRRFGQAYAWIALGTLVKLFPLALLPIAVIAQLKAREEGHRPWRQPLLSVSACLASIALVVGVAALVDPRHALSWLTFGAQRPDEVESVPATLLWLTSFAGLPVHSDASFGSLNLVGSGSTVVNAAADAGLAVGMIAVYWSQWRGRLTSAQAAVAAVLVLLCTSRVLSAQYFVWLAPLLALCVGFELRWLFLFLLTGLVFPALWGVEITQAQVPSYGALILAVIAARNALLVALTVVFLRSPGRALEEKARRVLRRGVQVLE